MTKDTIRLLASYNAYANKGMGEAIAKLSAEQWERNFGGYFGSVQAVCAHIFSGDFTWTKRLLSLRSFEASKQPLLGIPHPKDVKPFSTIAEYLARRSELDAILEAFAAELTDEDLAATLAFKNWAGEQQSKNFGGLCMHMFNHATHHRGAVSTYLDIAGIQNDFSNLIRIL